VRTTPWLVFLIAASCGTSSNTSSDGGATDLGPPGWRHGVVIVQSTTRSFAHADFVDSPDGRPEVFTASPFGPCTVDVYASLGTIGTPTTTGGGTISITGGAQPVTLKPVTMSGMVLYPSFTAATPLWNGGESLTLAIAGDAVPAFSVTQVAPSRVTITQPPSSSGPLTIPHDRDFTIAWSGGSAGAVRFTLTFGASGPVAETQLVCLFPSGPGQGTVPAAALAMLPHGVTGTLAFNTTGTPDGCCTQDGDYQLDIGLRSDAAYSGSSMVTIN
jgi:hypothetical protein